jgi:hypothetical protein
MIGVIDAARKGVFDDRAATPIKPCQKAGTRIIHQLELDRPTRLLLNDDRPGPDLAAADQFADFNLYDIAAPQLAIDRQIEKCSVTDATVLIEEEANGSNLTWLQRSFGSDLAASIPSPAFLRTRIIL